MAGVVAPPGLSHFLAPQFIASGGIAGLIAREISAIQVVNANLTLEGLRLIYEMNR